MNCPCCGQPIDEAPDLRVVCELVGAQPNTKFQQLVRKLVEAYPNGCSRADLVSAMHGDNRNAGPLTAENGASVLVWRLRRRMEAYGWTVVQASRNSKYRLARL